MAQTVTKQFTTVIELLKQTTVLAVVSNFLRAKGLHHSASGWDEMRDARLKPVLDAGSITLEDLVGLLRDAEESGRQHVFLFKCSEEDAIRFMDRRRVKAAADRLGIEAVLENPLVLDQPDEPTFAEIRWTSAKVDLSLAVKMIETRVSRKFLGEDKIDGFITRRYKEEKERAVSLAKLHRDGLLELRIASQSNGNRYGDELKEFWRRIAAFLPPNAFTQISLKKVKDKLWKDRVELADEVRFSDSTLKNDQGTSLKATTGSGDSSLFADAGVVSSFENFFEHQAYCDSSNIWFRQQASGVPSKDIHVMLAGDLNEFAINAACTPQDYNHVLSRLRTLNR